MSQQVAQMFEQGLDAIKGWFDLHSLDKSAKLAAAVLATADDVPAGRVAHINDDGEFALGGSGTQMPIFLWNGKFHPDVSNSGTSPVTNVDHWVAIAPTGVMSGLVATGGYELQTTEFDTDQTYLPNEPLTCDANGILSNQAAVVYTNYIVGITSWHVGAGTEDAAATGPSGNNAHGVATLTFWPYFLPAAP